LNKTRGVVHFQFPINLDSFQIKSGKEKGILLKQYLLFKKVPKIKEDNLPPNQET